MPPVLVSYNKVSCGIPVLTLRTEIVKKIILTNSADGLSVLSNEILNFTVLRNSW